MKEKFVLGMFVEKNIDLEKLYRNLLLNAVSFIYYFGSKLKYMSLNVFISS